MENNDNNNNGSPGKEKKIRLVWKISSITLKTRKQ